MKSIHISLRKFVRRSYFLAFLFTTNFIFASPVVFNDTIFENYCVSNFDTNNDGVVDTTEVDFIQNLQLQNLGISNLTGIEHFTRLRTLNLKGNNLLWIDLSSNVEIRRLNLTTNPLQSLDLTNNVLIKNLNVAKTSLTSIAVNNQLYLEKLILNNTLISSIQLNDNAFLKELHCSKTFITSLDLRGNNNLEKLIYVDFYSNSGGLSSIDISNNPNLQFLTLNNHSQLTNVDLANNPSLQQVNIQDTGIASIELKYFFDLYSVELRNNFALSTAAIIDNPVLQNLTIENSSLTNFDLINSNNIQNLILQNLGLTNLNISGLQQLTALNCSQNNLSSLNASLNTQLSTLTCDNNSLQVLNIKNGNNSNLLTMNALANPSLNCINVDDPINATAKQIAPYNQGWAKDSQAQYSDNCGSNTNISVNFEPDFSICAGSCIKLEDFFLISNLNCPNYTVEFYYFDQGQRINVLGSGFSGISTTTYYGELTDLCTGYNYTDTIEITVNSATSPYCSGIQPVPCGRSTISTAPSNIKVLVYPNPNSGTFYIKHLDDNPISYQIYNALGVLQSKNKILNNGETRQLSFDRKGLYFIHLMDEELLTIKKIIIQ